MGDIWYLTFHGFGSVKHDCQIGLAYGKDLYNLTMLEEPIVPTSDNASDPDSGTTGRREVICADGWYYMVYEISTDSGVDGSPYYDFGKSNWDHSFARSKDFIHWEKISAPLCSPAKGEMSLCGPAWMVIGDNIWVYYKTVNNCTKGMKLSLK